MKAAERRRIARAIKQAAPELHENGKLLAVTPLGQILRGIYLEDSSDPSQVYIWAFAQPLYVPTQTVAFDLGMRLGGTSKTWSLTDLDLVADVVQGEGLAFLRDASSPEQLASWRFLEGRNDPHAREARAYSLVASDQLVEGARALRDLARSLSGGAGWMHEMQKRATQLAELAETDPAGTRDRLAGWQAESAHALRVDSLP